MRRVAAALFAWGGALAGVAAAGGAAAQAQLELGAARTDYDTAVSSATGWRLGAGWRLHEMLLLEIGYVDLGEGSVQGTSARYRVDGVSAGARGYWPFAEGLRGVGQIGVFQYNARMTVLGNEHRNDGSGVYFGLGAEWSFAGPLHLGVEWRRYDVHDINPNVLGAYVGGRF